MRYDDRVVLVRNRKKPGILGDDKEAVFSEPIPCRRGELTDAEQIGIFGSYNLEAFKLYLEGQHSDIEGVAYQGRERSIKAIKKHRRHTVVFV